MTTRPSGLLSAAPAKTSGHAILPELRELSVEGGGAGHAEGDGRIDSWKLRIVACVCAVSVE